MTDVPPNTLFGLKNKDIGLAALIVKTAVAVCPSSEDVIVDVVLEATFTTVTVKVAEVAPAAIVTEAGTVALLLEDFNVTT